MRFGVKRLMIGTALVADLFGLVLAATRGGRGNSGCWCGWHGVSPFFRVVARLEVNRGACPFHQSITTREWLSLASMAAALVFLSAMLVRRGRAAGQSKDRDKKSRSDFGPS